MFTLPKKFFFALEATLYIACHLEARPINGKEICKYHGVSTRYLEPILQYMVKGKILRGVRGPKGGYVLAKERRKITLADIFLLVQDMEASETELYTYTALGKSIIVPLWADMEAETLSRLQRITLEDVWKQVDEKGVVEMLKTSGDFVI